ncbi:unnamed protein product [Ilex paraguariensis]|uniref:Uncharacterized protein n=1 Tax=Ilex paraguariensis TaxID=185542 RepID=A0ABC8UMC2_9AQUA
MTKCQHNPHVVIGQKCTINTVNYRDKMTIIPTLTTTSPPPENSQSPLSAKSNICIWPTAAHSPTELIFLINSFFNLPSLPNTHHHVKQPPARPMYSSLLPPTTSSQAPMQSAAQFHCHPHQSSNNTHTRHTTTHVATARLHYELNYSQALQTKPNLHDMTIPNAHSISH